MMVVISYLAMYTGQEIAAGPGAEIKNSSNGARDTRGAPVNACYLHERQPNSRLDIADAGHFAWEGGRYLRALVTSGWAGATRMPARASPLGSNGTKTVVLAVWINAEMTEASAT